MPLYDEGSPLRREVAALAKTASEKVAEWLGSKNMTSHDNNMDARECGRFRNQIRELIREEMGEIEERIAEILGVGDCAGPREGHGRPESGN